MKRLKDIRPNAGGTGHTVYVVQEDCHTIYYKRLEGIWYCDLDDGLGFQSTQHAPACVLRAAQAR